MRQYSKKKKKGGKLWITLIIVAVVSFILGYWFSAGQFGV